MLIKTINYHCFFLYFVAIQLLTSFIVIAVETEAIVSPKSHLSSQSIPFMQEHQLPSAFTNDIKKFWQQGLFSHFNAADKIRINYAQFLQRDKSQQCIVIVSGRSESYLKYQELSYDLYQQGYSIFLLDHRGQGLSERLLANPHKGYVANFTDYELDLGYFINNIVNVACQNKPYLLAHSMGSVIATRYMQQFPSSIKAAVLSSPMLGFSSGPIPTFIAKGLISITGTLNHWFSDTPWYFIGQKDYQATDFSQNELTHSKKRYQNFVALYQQTPKIQLGGVTVNWLREGIKAQNKVFSQLEKLTTPIQVLQASEDSIIDNQAQNDFCQQLHQLQPQSCPNAKPIVIEGAYHELFIESDNMRGQALSQILAWFKQHS